MEIWYRQGGRDEFMNGIVERRKDLLTSKRREKEYEDGKRGKVYV